MDHLLEKATRQHTKDHNNRLVLRAIYEYGAISRADLARATQLTRTTVSEVVADLIERELVQEVGHGAVSVGRTPVLLSVIADARHMLAMTVTNDEINGALVNLRGSLVQRTSRTLPDRNGHSVLAAITAVADELTAAATRPLLGIGINTPGLIDTANGVVLRTINFGWEDVPLRALLHTRYGVPVYVANDSQTLALAHYRFDEAHNSPNLALIKVGRGIGAGMILGGHLFAGDGYGAGEIGHMVVAEHGPRCKCGNYGCLETVAASTVILERAAELAAADPTSRLHGVHTPTMTMLAEAALQHDRAAQSAIAEAGYYLGIAVANIVSVLNLRRIVITGRVAPLGALLAESVQAALARRSLPILARDTQIDVIALDQDAPLLGAITPLLTYELGLARLHSEG